MKIKPLILWFHAEKRDLPWRKTTDPYAIWVSEVMLQQTQVATVIPYYTRWMSRYPTLKSLATASFEDVIKSWEGLGYYSRAKNLYEGAKHFVTHFGGKIPPQESVLKEIKGFGPYTIGAVLSFAFHKKKCAIDGNVTRVLTRYFGIVDDIAKSATKQALYQLNESFLPDEEPWIVSEALIELGALICQKKPKCQTCPLKYSCLAFQNGMTEKIPFQEKKGKIEHLHRLVAVVTHDSHLLVKKEDEGKIMSHLYEFPYFNITPENLCEKTIIETVTQFFSSLIIFKTPLPQEKHSFTRYRAALYPFLFEIKQRTLIDGYQWVPYSEITHLPFSSGHRKVLHSACRLLPLT